MIKFKEWLNRSTTKAITEDAEPIKTATPSNAEYLAQISKLKEMRAAANKEGNEFQAEIHDLDIKLLQMEMEKNRLNGRKTELIEAEKIAMKKKPKEDERKNGARE